MFNKIHFNYHFTPKKSMTMLAILTVLLLSTLGYWQIKRGHEKMQMQAAQEKIASLPAKAWNPEMKSPAQYQKIAISGHFLPQIMFLDNQYHDHQFGYQVISPMGIGKGQVILVDRGWVVGQQNRQVLPVITVPAGKLNIAGNVYYPPDNYWILGQTIEKRSNQVFVIEKFDIKLIKQVLHKSIYPFIIRLDKNARHGFVREWAVVSMSPERHYGYALQWFVMALVVIFIYIVLNLKKIDENN